MGSGGVAIAALPTVICLKVPFSDGLGGGKNVGDGRRKNIYWGFSGYYYLFTSSLELHYWMCFYIPSGASEAKND